MRVKVVFDPQEDGRYAAYVPAFPGCVSEGDNLDHARAMIREAAEGWLDVVVEHPSAGPIPETPELIEQSMDFGAEYRTGQPIIEEMDFTVPA